ncbi:hydroxymethylbilane synthase, partial [Pseudomonas aeruginosa]
RAEARAPGGRGAVDLLEQGAEAISEDVYGEAGHP